MIERSIATADAMKGVCSVAAHLLAFVRQATAMSGSAELAINKAFAAQIFNDRTDALAALAQPGAALFGTQHAQGGRVVVFESRSGSTVGRSVRPA